MGNIVKTIENRFANSVKNRVKLYCVGERPRGSARESIRAWLQADWRTVFKTRGTVCCMGLFGGDSPEECQDRQIYEAVMSYGDLSIDAILNSKNSIIRALAMLDFRVGKYRLSKINVKHQPAIVQHLFLLRCEAEGLYVEKDTHCIMARLQPKYSSPQNKMDQNERLTDILSNRKRRDVQALFAKAEHGIDLKLLACPIAREIVKQATSKRRQLAYVRSLKQIASSSKLVNETYIKGLIELLRDYPAWMRLLDSWLPRTHNAQRQFSSLARHLFAQYDVPVFMDEAWINGNRLHQKWFKHIATGKNIRTAVDLPVPLTKMMAHHFCKAPDRYSIMNAFRWAQARAMGADAKMADAVVQTRLSEDFKNNDFWCTVIAFFARNPMLDTAHVGPIVDYIYNQKYVDVITFVERGVAGNRGPAQPNFTMKGRTANSLLQQVERWHQDLGKCRSGSSIQWSKSAIANFEFIEGSADRKNMRIWRIFELLSSKELIAEGRDMKHCVASYAQSCAHGQCGIWSMSLQTEGGTEKVLTIEVRLQNKTVGQVRGKMNRLPTAKEREIIQRWATNAGLKYE